MELHVEECARCKTEGLIFFEKLPYSGVFICKKCGLEHKIKIYKDPHYGESMRYMDSPYYADLVALDSLSRWLEKHREGITKAVLGQ